MKRKSTLLILLALVPILTAFRESVGPVSIEAPFRDGWSMAVNEDLPEDGKIMIWTSGDQLKAITIVRVLLPKDATGALDDYVKDWRSGFEEEARKVLSGGFREIKGARFGFSKVEADTPDGPATILQLCTVDRKFAYMIGFLSHAGDPEDDAAMKGALESMLIEAGQPGATDNPGDAQRFREDH